MKLCTQKKLVHYITLCFKLLHCGVTSSGLVTVALIMLGTGLECYDLANISGRSKTRKRNLSHGMYDSMTAVRAYE